MRNDQCTLTKLSNTFSLEKVKFNINQRFQCDYEMIEQIGKGENSTVYKVRNLLDNSVYAVREIIFKVNKSNQKTIQKDINNVLHEVRLLARLKSEHVITYNNSWIELKLKECKDESYYLKASEDESLIKKHSTKESITDLNGGSFSEMTPNDDLCLNDMKIK